MSDISTPVAAASPVAAECPGVWRTLGGLLALPFVALWKSWSAPNTVLDLRQYSSAELLDMGASPEMLAEAEALREFELSRANALMLYYW
ncbi:hypothetical protein [Bordetella genomosp. 11]|uniref:Uncharacterized protein n=1 Tax=Bordetella genomosp. 11 TaxID=1416808 RepID=A0A261UIB8_9BORD|nr:hypothetical protein [Bordetella genomosp. 11]OZI61666.1 hypothetical protein CAL28_20570 [Bordetella genomosp. 11]